MSPLRGSTGVLDRLRAGRTPLENHHIDELVVGSLPRREFLRRGAVLGMSATTMGAILSACGDTHHPRPRPSVTSPRRGGTLEVATQTPTTAIDPMHVDDTGGMDMLCQTGEFLVYDDNQALQLVPMLATRWTHNGDGSVWTFTIRSGVTFHDGRRLTADDVVYTMRQLADPANASNALSTFTGVLLPDGVRAVDSQTVAFHLESANGNFPYLVSSDNYNAIIVPRGTDFARWEKTFQGTGPFVLDRYTPSHGARFIANPHYWGTKPLLDAVSFHFYEDQQSQITALQNGDVDVITQFVPTGAEALLSDPRYTIIKLQASNHRELSMRCDRPPFTDARVRRAIALTLDRPALVNTLLHGFGAIGNDNPFAPTFTSTNSSVPQRSENLAQARQLLAAAGHPRGFSTTLHTDVYQEVPQLAQAIKTAAGEIGVDISVVVESQAAYYGTATFGDSNWLDSTMSLVNYGDRGVPNVFLDAPLTTHGSWNAAHFHDPAYDRLFRDYVSAIDLQTQRAVAGSIERLLLEQTPIIIPYFIDGLTATTTAVRGVAPAASSQIFLGGASTA